MLKNGWAIPVTCYSYRKGTVDSGVLFSIIHTYFLPN